jgi:hypothetical protein
MLFLSSRACLSSSCLYIGMRGSSVWFIGTVHEKVVDAKFGGGVHDVFEVAEGIEYGIGVDYSFKCLAARFIAGVGVHGG